MKYMKLGKLPGKLFLLALPLTLAAGCIHSHRSARVVYSPSGEVITPAPTSDSPAMRVYPAPGSEPSRLTDPDLPLAEDVRQMVAGDSALKKACRNVDIEIVQGQVTLRGTVKTEHQRRLIQERLAKLAGVASIDNRLAVDRR